MRTMAILSITLFFGLMFASTAFYCGNHPYDPKTKQCVCEDRSCCTPELYPNVCCKNSTLSLPLLGEWILADTTDPYNRINAELPLIISYQPEVPYLIQVPWFNISGGPQIITYNFTNEFDCNYAYYWSIQDDPYGYRLILNADPPYLNISLSFHSYLTNFLEKAYFVPVTQSKFDLISETNIF